MNLATIFTKIGSIFGGKTADQGSKKAATAGPAVGERPVASRNRDAAKLARKAAKLSRKANR